MKFCPITQTNQKPPTHVCFTDTCYVLSFAVIMLNTSLHNPNVKDKPSIQRFTAMNRGINDGGDLPEELLRVREMILMIFVHLANYMLIY